MNKEHLKVARGMVYLTEYLKGRSIKSISAQFHTERRTVHRYMEKASRLLIDRAHETVLTEIFPVVVRLYKAELERQIARAQRGEEVNMDTAERIMKGMFILDSPQLKDVQVEQSGKELPPAPEPDTLIGIMAIKRPSLPKPADIIESEPIPAEKVVTEFTETPDGHQD